jgi:hypothetical protein
MCRCWAAQVEYYREIRVKSLHICNSRGGYFLRCAVAICDDGDNVIPSRAEVRTDHVGSVHRSRKEHYRNLALVLLVSSPRQSRPCFNNSVIRRSPTAPVSPATNTRVVRYSQSYRETL